MTGDAGFSECRTWRYWLTRSWADGGRTLMVIGLNPSTADESVDDPTIRRCIGYAKAWGFSQLAMLNLFAYRATDPRQMKVATDPVGRENDQTLLWWAGKADMILGAWGAHGGHNDRAFGVRLLLGMHSIHCLGHTANGQPRHPLYLKSSAQPEIYEQDRQVAGERSLGLRSGAWRNSQWETEPDVGRVAHGVPSRIHRLRALGNAVVPQVAEYIGRLIVEADKEMRGAA